MKLPTKTRNVERLVISKISVRRWFKRGEADESLTRSRSRPDAADLDRLLKFLKCDERNIAKRDILLGDDTKLLGWIYFLLLFTFIVFYKLYSWLVHTTQYKTDLWLDDWSGFDVWAWMTLFSRVGGFCLYVCLWRQNFTFQRDRLFYCMRQDQLLPSHIDETEALNWPMEIRKVASGNAKLVHHKPDLHDKVVRHFAVWNKWRAISAGQENLRVAIRFKNCNQSINVVMD